MGASEAALIERILARTATRRGVRVGIGDDAAVLDGQPSVVLAHDMLVQDVHFRWSTARPEDVGYRALAVNLSDLAAMGARPRAALVGLGIPPGPGATALVDGIYTGLEELAAATGCSIVGGDLSRAPVAVLGVTVLGDMPEGVAPVLRSGARVGDAVCITGPVGGSAAGLALLDDPGRTAAERAAAVRAHLRPWPRLEEGVALARAGVHAMMDCSDGLAIDLGRLGVASGVRVVLDLERVPLGPAVTEVFPSPREAAVAGGEDYELIVALPPGRAVPGVPLHPVGRVVPGPPGLEVVCGDTPVTLTRLGWDHDLA